MNYWLNPAPENMPERYKRGKEKSQFLLGLVEEYTGRRDYILEIGCNVGRNLWHLWQAGYKNLHAVEINPAAIDEMHKTYDMTPQIHIGAVEDVMPTLGEYDLIFTMAVLCHLPRSSDFIFNEIAQRTKKIITIEDERHNRNRHTQRNYKEVFEGLGLRQVKSYETVPGMNQIYKARVFAW